MHSRFKIVQIAIPDSASVLKIATNELPSDWYNPELYPVCQQAGDRWIEGGSHLLLQVPSSIIREETNVLINPHHPEFKSVKITDIREFRFDERL